MLELGHPAVGQKALENALIDPIITLLLPSHPVPAKNAGPLSALQDYDALPVWQR